MKSTLPDSAADRFAFDINSTNAADAGKQIHFAKFLTKGIASVYATNPAQVHAKFPAQSDKFRQNSWQIWLRGLAFRRRFDNLRL